jgi:hypothetical protein
MQKLIESAVWTPVPDVLVSNAEFEQNMQRFSDTNDSWTQLITIGSVWMNNLQVRLEAQKNARKVGCHKI